MAEIEKRHRHKAFPVGFVTSGKHLLIVGGCGDDLCRLKHAVTFDWDRITVILPPSAPPLCANCQKDGRVTVKEGCVGESDLDGVDLVIAELHDLNKASTVAGWCRAKRIPVNIMDIADCCDIHYSSLVARGPLLLSIASGGDVPALSSVLRKELEKRIGTGWAVAAEALAEIRQRLPCGKERMETLKSLAQSKDLLALIEENDERRIRSWIEDAAARLENRG
ncbi:MAG: hypothetical protein KJ626_06000 [Verrucomicrobia bacterium]|nr:hypothetical protein [Verrucomicrobiota bacterium]